ncbi:protein of unknown function [Cupriavidus taiwanensis]|uniref:Uncharacterized protein n=1 Tax=Cupriavidus taiwanensis TaxID=164546 RepID=A0A375ICD5_9BURK|nr:protein of unknown function [Cupriavidus taiwanensis]
MMRKTWLSIVKRIRMTSLDNRYLGHAGGCAAAPHARKPSTRKGFGQTVRNCTFHKNFFDCCKVAIAPHRRGACAPG